MHAGHPQSSFLQMVCLALLAPILFGCSAGETVQYVQPSAVLSGDIARVVLSNPGLIRNRVWVFDESGMVLDGQKPAPGGFYPFALTKPFESGPKTQLFTSGLGRADPSPMVKLSREAIFDQLHPKHLVIIDEADASRSLSEANQTYDQICASAPDTSAVEQKALSIPGSVSGRAVASWKMRNMNSKKVSVEKSVEFVAVEGVLVGAIGDSGTITWDRRPGILNLRIVGSFAAGSGVIESLNSVTVEAGKTTYLQFGGHYGSTHDSIEKK